MIGQIAALIPLTSKCSVCAWQEHCFINPITQTFQQGNKHILQIQSRLFHTSKHACLCKVALNPWCTHETKTIPYTPHMSHLFFPFSASMRPWISWSSPGRTWISMTGCAAEGGCSWVSVTCWLRCVIRSTRLCEVTSSADASCTSSRLSHMRTSNIRIFQLFSIWWKKCLTLFRQAWGAVGLMSNPFQGQHKSVHMREAFHSFWLQSLAVTYFNNTLNVPVMRECSGTILFQ